MRFIELEVRPAILIHGYDDDNQPIEENLDGQDFVPKLIAVDRIQSLTGQYVLVDSSHGRIMYWEYSGSMTDVSARLNAAGLVID